MKRVGILSCNIHVNFTNYGSALQSWALSQSIRKMGYDAWLIDYCPDALLEVDTLNPMKVMWDQDTESRKMLELTMPALKENYYKFDDFWNKRFNKTRYYDSKNFNDIKKEIDAFVCGSDTIFCVEEFKGFENGYYANYPCMKGNSVSYAASFADSKFDEKTYPILKARLQNFKAIGIREQGMLDYINKNSDVPCSRTIDPTLLLSPEEYEPIMGKKQLEEKYLLLYTRRYNPKMEAYAEKIARKKGLKLVEISLRATNAEKGHIMRYDAGVEEFISLVKNAEFVVTNSFHGLIFAVQYKRPFVVFSREQAGTKITELLELFGIEDHMFISGEEEYKEIDYEVVHKNIEEARKTSLEFLKMELELI